MQATFTMAVARLGRLLLVCISTWIVIAQNQFDLRFTGNGSTNASGRVELYQDGGWKTICGSTVSDLEATVICKQQGFTYNGVILTNIQASFGIGHTNQSIITGLRCIGTENTIGGCLVSTASNLCTHDQDIGIDCLSTNYASITTPVASSLVQNNVQQYNCSTNQDIRIKGPPNEFGYGFVEVRINGVWGAVCDDWWGNADATVACNMLCIPQCCDTDLTAIAGPLEMYKVDVLPNFVMDDVDCKGNETLIFDCPHKNSNQQNCVAGEYAAVRCKPASQNIPQVSKPGLKCENETFTITFPNTNVDHIMIYNRTSNNTCDVQKHIVGQTTVVTFKHYECDTRITFNTTHIFFTNYAILNMNTGSVIRENTILEFICVADRKTAANVSYVPQVEFVSQTAYTDWDMYMSLYNDTRCTSIYEITPSTKVRMSQLLVAKVQLITNNPDLILIVPDCFATPTLDINHPNRYNLIIDNCPIDKTVNISTYNNTVVKFEFSAFRFSGVDVVFIHCLGRVCEKTEKYDLCDRTCRNSTSITGRKKREANKFQEKIFTTLFLLQDSDTEATTRQPKPTTTVERVSTISTSITRTTTAPSMEAQTEKDIFSEHLFDDLPNALQSGKQNFADQELMVESQSEGGEKNSGGGAIGGALGALVIVVVIGVLVIVAVIYRHRLPELKQSILDKISFDRFFK